MSADTIIKRQLLAIGGTRISPQANPFAEFVARFGYGFDHAVVLRKMEPNNCHGNVGELWLNRKRRRIVAICTGYGLSNDGMWRPHSWALSKTSGRISVAETTVLRLRYFGFEFEESGANWFAETFTAEARS